MNRTTNLHFPAPTGRSIPAQGIALGQPSPQHHSALKGRRITGHRAYEH